MKLDRKTLLLISGATVLFVFAAVLCIAAWSIATAPASGLERPKVTDWMQAWGSIAGVFAGLAAAGAAAALLLHERHRAATAERLLEQERAENALHVPRSVVALPARFGGGVNPNGEQYIDQVHLAVYNHGSTGIRNVAVIVALPEGGPRLLLARAAMLGPGGRWPIDQKSGKPVWYPGPSNIGTLDATVTLCFIDYTNQAWRITSDGEVAPTTTPYFEAEGAAEFPVV
ncbi:hypothetical protein F8280_18830 [Micromonospora noduli]|uniref:hypothetical protein n=1 Tax=Micromonospora noduli TaxID=709876 RepID=UPI00124B51B5|nr:hypothetical protein [Micromonospora noduli]KAB1922512.1 hypothetical protein F8280_18830 [Micromonospora noduli]